MKPKKALKSRRLLLQSLVVSFLLAAFLWPLPLAAREDPFRGPWSAAQENEEPAASEKDPGVLLSIYGRTLSRMDGDHRCPMSPSCSAYARECFHKHGPFLGVVMTCDRLMRCGRDETRLSPKVMEDGETLTLDPVSENDFWLDGASHD